MKRKILLSATLLSVVLTSSAQQSGKTYIITGKPSNKFIWADIKEVDIATGKITASVFESEKSTYKIKALEEGAKPNEQELLPTNFGVAAAALDVRTNRLFFASMHFSDIRYVDLNKATPEFAIVKRNVIPVPGNKPYQDEANHLTRMVIAADGYGYAISNDANHLIRFSTGRKPVVEDLGPLVDAESNKGLSIHNKCTSWGGDMVADAFGQLVIISANHQVFTVDVNSRIATHTGSITGLPVNFTTNGAVVDADGQIVLSSANVFEGLYKMNSSDLKATPVVGSSKDFNASDMANGIFLHEKEAAASVKYNVTRGNLPVYEPGSGEARVFPNPVSGDQFNVAFDGIAAGKYTILLTDLAGRPLQQQVASITGNQVESFKIARKLAKGLYLVKAVDASKKTVFSQRIVLQ